MEKVSVRVEGIKPLLQHRFPMEEHGTEKSKKKNKDYEPTKECEKSLYKDDKGVIYQPAMHILMSLVNAGLNFKYEGKKSFKNVLKSSVFITPDAILHKFPKWEINLQSVIVGDARIVRARPIFNKWELEFEMEYDPSVISKSQLKEILDYAGNRVGLGDFRPFYGRFIVTKFD